MKLATIILGAGKGTRMKSDLPKVLHCLVGKPMLHHVIDTANELNSSKIVVVIGHKKQMVIDETSKVYPSDLVEFAVQEPQLGTAHAVSQTADNLRDFDGLVLVLSGDVPLIKSSMLNKMVQSHVDSDRSPSCSVMVTNTPEPKGYGRIVRGGEGYLEKIVEQKDIVEEKIDQIGEVNCGIYLFDAKKLFETLPKVDNNNKQKEYYLPRVVEIMLEEGEAVETFTNPDMSETHGVNTKEQLEDLEKMLSK